MNFFLKKVIIILGVIITNAVNAQSIDRQIISNTGEHQESLSYSLNFTIGEPITSYEESGSFKLTQGFQQNSSSSENEGTTSINNEALNVDYKLYPNPTKDFIHLEISSSEYIIFHLEVINIIGEVQKKDIEISTTSNGKKIDVTALSNGVYFIEIKDDNKNLLKSIKFLKY